MRAVCVERVHDSAPVGATALARRHAAVPRYAPAALLANSIDLVEDDDVELGGLAALLLLRLRVLEELSDLRLGAADELVENRRTVHDLRRSRLESLGDLSRDESLAAPGRTVKKHPSHVIDAHLLEEGSGEDARLEGAAEDHLELLVQAADPHGEEVELLHPVSRLRTAARRVGELHLLPLFLREEDSRLRHDLAALRGVAPLPRHRAAKRYRLQLSAPQHDVRAPLHRARAEERALPAPKYLAHPLLFHVSRQRLDVDLAHRAVVRGLQVRKLKRDGLQDEVVRRRRERPHGDWVPHREPQVGALRRVEAARRVLDAREGAGGEDLAAHLAQHAKRLRVGVVRGEPVRLAQLGERRLRHEDCVRQCEFRPRCLVDDQINHSAVATMMGGGGGGGDARWRSRRSGSGVSDRAQRPPTRVGPRAPRAAAMERRVAPSDDVRRAARAHPRCTCSVNRYCAARRHRDRALSSCDNVRTMARRQRIKP